MGEELLKDDPRRISDDLGNLAVSMRQVEDNLSHRFAELTGPIIRTVAEVDAKCNGLIDKYDTTMETLELRLAKFEEFYGQIQNKQEQLLRLLDSVGNFEDAVSVESIKPFVVELIDTKFNDIFVPLIDSLKQDIMSQINIQQISDDVREEINAKFLEAVGILRELDGLTKDVNVLEAHVRGIVNAMVQQYMKPLSDIYNRYASSLNIIGTSAIESLEQVRANVAITVENGLTQVADLKTEYDGIKVEGIAMISDLRKKAFDEVGNFGTMVSSKLNGYVDHITDLQDAFKAQLEIMRDLSITDARNAFQSLIPQIIDQLKHALFG